MWFLFFMKPITVRVRFASIQGSVFSYNERTVQSSVLLWLSDFQSQSRFWKEKQPQWEAISLSLFFSVFHQDLPPFTTPPSCHWRSECIYWVTLQDPVSCLFQCPILLSLEWQGVLGNHLIQLLYFVGKLWGLLEEIPSHLSTACSDKDEHLGIFAWISWWDNFLGIGDRLTTVKNFHQEGNMDETAD